MEHGVNPPIQNQLFFMNVDSSMGLHVIMMQDDGMSTNKTRSVCERCKSPAVKSIREKYCISDLMKWENLTIIYALHIKSHSQKNLL